MNSWLEGISLLIVAFFGLIGAIAAGVLVHEYSHAQDFSHVSSSSQICALSMPSSPSKLISTGLASYSFEVDPASPEVMQEVDRISRYTEFKAYSFTFIILLIFLICLEVVFAIAKKPILR